MDDQALPPIAPSLDYIENVIEERQALAEDTQTADAYFHPAWAKVEKMFNEQLALLAQPTSPELIADEYKIEDQAKRKATAVINQILQRVKDAVSSVEESKRK